MPNDLERVDPKVASLGLRNESALLIATRTVNQTTAAQRLGIAKQTHSDWIKEHGKRAAQVCAAHGIKWVPADDPYVDYANLAAIGRLARLGLDKLVPAVAEASLSGGRVEEETDTVRGDDV